MTTSQDASLPSSSVPPGIDAGFWRRTAPPDLRSLFTDIIGYEERNPQTNRQVETASLTIPLILSFGDPFESHSVSIQPLKMSVPPFWLGSVVLRFSFSQMAVPNACRSTLRPSALVIFSGSPWTC